MVAIVYPIFRLADLYLFDAVQKRGRADGVIDVIRLLNVAVHEIGRFRLFALRFLAEGVINGFESQFLKSLDQVCVTLGAVFVIPYCAAVEVTENESGLGSKLMLILI